MSVQILANSLKEKFLESATQFGRFFEKVLNKKSCAFFCCLLIILTSILVRSTRDIGHDSAACIEITKKILNGGKYYQDFFENNLPLFFYLNSIGYFLAKAFKINPIIASEITSNLIGVVTLFFTTKILSRSSIYKDRAAFNLLIISFACGFFLRVFTLQFNEFGTKSTYFLALIFIYVSYQLIEISRTKKISFIPSGYGKATRVAPRLARIPFPHVSGTYGKKIDQIIIGILAALLFCLKPHYGILPIVFEIRKMLERKSFSVVFCLRNYVTLAVLISYLLLILIFFPDYLEAVPKLAEIYYEIEVIPMVFYTLQPDAFPILAFTFLNIFLLKKFDFLTPFFLTNLAISLVVISELVGGYDQRFIIYSAALPSVILTIFLIVKNGYVDWKKDGLLLAAILFLPQLDGKNIFGLFFNLIIFWWVLVLVFSREWITILKDKKLSDNSFLGQIFILQNKKSWLCFFIGLATLTALLFLGKLANNLAWLLSAIIYVLFVRFHQNLYQKVFATKKFSTIFAVTIFFVFAYFINLHLTTIFDDSSTGYEYRSPNYTNDKIIKNILNYSAKDEDVLIISGSIFVAYPVFNYSEKENHTPILNLLPLYQQIKKPIMDFDNIIAGRKYLLSRVKLKMSDKKNKLVFIENQDIFSNGQCQIGFLEYYFRDPEFKKIFLENYTFFDNILYSEAAKNGDQKKSEIFKRKVEVYIRKIDQ